MSSLHVRALTCATSVFALSILAVRSASAAWPVDPTQNLRVCEASGAPVNVPDGARGAILVWPDTRYGQPHVYAQRIAADGTSRWTADGIWVGATNYSGYDFDGLVAAISDGRGGAIVVWRDYRSDANCDLYAQRIGPGGQPLWSSSGVGVCVANGKQDAAQLVSDGAGGVVVAWMDYRAGSPPKAYAQRVSGAGVPQWTNNGVLLGSGLDAAGFFPVATADATGGAIVAWDDFQGALAGDIRVQRVSGSGSVRWGANGVGICTATNPQIEPRIVADGSGGAVVAWRDYRVLTNGLIYAQRVDSAGIVAWGANGVAVCPAVGEQVNAGLLADGSGGAIVAWVDGRAGRPESEQWDVYAQHVLATGGADVAWPAAGLAVYTAGGAVPMSEAVYSELLTMVSDDSRGAIIAWKDERLGSKDVFAQRVSIAGAVRWPVNGVPVSTAAGNQEGPQLVTNGLHGAIATWTDSRPAGGIYAQRVDSLGALGNSAVPTRSPGPALVLEPPFPNPASAGPVRVSFMLAEAGPAVVTLYDVHGRCVDERPVVAPGPGRRTVELGPTGTLPPGVYLVRLRQGTAACSARFAMLR